MRLIDADKLIEVFEEQDHYLWGLPDKENPHKRAKQGQLNWCINMVHEQPTIPYDMKWNPDCEDCLPEGIDDCIECHKRHEGR